MAYAEQSPRPRGPINEHAPALAREWRGLTRAATGVALLTSPAFFLVLFDSDHASLAVSLVLTALAVIVFRGLVEVVARKLIPSPSLYGADESMRADDLVARRRYWYWRSKFRRLPIYALIVFGVLGVCQALFAFSGVHGAFFNPLPALRNLFPADELPSLGLVFVQLPMLLFINFFIFFGPFLFMAVRQIHSYEPGDATWGVKIDDVRGQAEAKDEITRVITLWQSGEEFEKAGGKRERGLLFLGAPGTGKTMISKAIATNFNCPFVTIPGSGFAGMFIGMDAITVQYLAHKARKLAKKWGGQCIVFIDEIDAVGMRRQALQGAPASTLPSSVNELGFFGANGSITPSGDLVIESRAWREQQFAQRAEVPRTPGYAALAQRVNDGISRIIPGFGMGGMGGQALNQLLVVMDGIDEPPMMRKFFTNRINTFLDAMFVVPSKIGKARLRLRPPPPRPDGSPYLVPDPDQGRSAGHLRPLPGQGRPRARPRHRAPARRARADHQRLLPFDDRAVLLDGADARAFRGTTQVRLVRHRRGDDDGRDRHCTEHRLHSGGDPRGRDPRGRPRRGGPRLPGEGAALDPALDPQARRLARALPEHGEGRALLALPQLCDGPADHDPRRHGRRAGVLRRELPRSRRP